MPRKMAREPGSDSAAAEAAATGATRTSPTIAPASKISLVLDLLHREDGASLAELVAATGWLPHTTRAALTGLRKKGHPVERDERDGETRYVIRTAH